MAGGTLEARSVEVNGTLRLVNLQYNSHLDDPSSQMFRNYADYICSEFSTLAVIRMIFQCSVLTESQLPKN